MPFNSAYPYDLPFLPPRDDLINVSSMSLLIKARAELGELKGYSSGMPNQLLLLSPAIIKESLASSEIENINTTIINVFQNQLFPEAEQRQPDKEVLRYRDAVIEGFESLKKYGLTTRAILDIKKVLIPDLPMAYRTTQNGIKNNTTGEILYLPPEASKINGLMGNLEKFINSSNDELDPLIKCAIMHYQFEAIHPFSDGNGRAGRILMVLYLVQQNILNFPILYISGYINKNKTEYYKLLLNVTSSHDWNSYISFMLQAYYLQAKETKELLFKIMNSHYEFKKLLKKDHRKIYSADLAEALYAFPIITPAKLATELDVHRDTASGYLKRLKSAGLLVEKKVGRYHFYSNKNLITIIYK